METILGYVIGSAILTAILYPFIRMSESPVEMTPEERKAAKKWSEFIDDLIHRAY